jgi:A/G-specific adenine glycosylase
MLQQTQVATVLGYYDRFIDRFPDVRALAAASADDVLAMWSGLGYYSRARNLHRCAQEIVLRFGGEFPANAAELVTLPGIGRSTAAAIAAFCFGERVAILDGNVKRVLSRVLAFDTDLANAKAVNELWSQAEALLPTRELHETMPRYTQGLMDLGATVCLLRDPSCLVCPAHDVCEARRKGDPQKFPVKTKKLKRTAQSVWLLRAHSSDGAVWLHKRPPSGVWAGLYCLPAFDSRQELQEALPPGAEASDGAAFKHVLTHRDLHLHPVEVRVPGKCKLQADGDWFSA